MGSSRLFFSAGRYLCLPLRRSCLHARPSSTSSTPDLAPEVLRPPSKTRLIYPLVLFSLLTTVTINLRTKKLETDAAHQRLNAQISLLEELLADGRIHQPGSLDDKARREIDRRLTMVGLKPHFDTLPAATVTTAPVHQKISWRQVFFGPTLEPGTDTTR